MSQDNKLNNLANLMKANDLDINIGLTEKSKSCLKANDFLNELNTQLHNINLINTFQTINSKIAEFFNIDIVALLSKAWKKYNEIKKAFEDTKVDPEKEVIADIAAHTFKSKHEPQLEISLNNMAKKIYTFNLDLEFKVMGAALLIKHGEIRKIITACYEIKIILKYKKTKLFEKTVKSKDNFEKGLQI